MSPVASQQKHVIKANLVRCLKMIAIYMVTGICRSVLKKDLFFKLQHKVTILYSSLTSFKNVKLAETFSMKKRQKCKK